MLERAQASQQSTASSAGGFDKEQADRIMNLQTENAVLVKKHAQAIEELTQKEKMS